jgi:hypothetical protein
LLKAETSPGRASVHLGKKKRRGREGAAVDGGGSRSFY